MKKVNGSGKETMPINWINVFDAIRNELTFCLLRKRDHITSIASSVIVDSQPNMGVIFKKTRYYLL